MNKRFLTLDLALIILNLSLVFDITEDIDLTGSSNLLYEIALNINGSKFYSEKDLTMVSNKLLERYGLTLLENDVCSKVVEYVKLFETESDITEFVNLIKSIEFDEDNDFRIIEGVNFIYGTIKDIPFTLAVINNFGSYSYELTWVEEDPKNLYFEDLIIMQFNQIDTE